jgi:hypothetical protein
MFSYISFFAVFQKMDTGKKILFFSDVIFYVTPNFNTNDYYYHLILLN